MNSVDQNVSEHVYKVQLDTNRLAGGDRDYKIDKAVEREQSSVVNG